MAVLYITIGISGSGKSTWINKESSLEDLGLPQGDLIICPYDIRKELTGNVSDQSRNNEVFATAYQRLADSKAEQDVYWSATSLNPKNIEDVVSADAGKHSVCLVWFESSKDWKLCRTRVRNALRDGEDRSNTDITITTKEGESLPLIQVMARRYEEIRKQKSQLEERFHATSIVVE